MANELLSNNIKVFRTTEEVSGFAAGSFYVPIQSKSTEVIKQFSANIGADVKTIDKKPIGITVIEPARIALWDTYGGSMASGWMRWIFEQFHFILLIA